LEEEIEKVKQMIDEREAQIADLEEQIAAMNKPVPEPEPLPVVEEKYVADYADEVD